MNVGEKIKQYADLVNNHITELFPNPNCSEKNLIEAMNYAVTNGGKRIRPFLVLEFCNACGTNENDALDIACAIEMIHSYSLIHDDLPCMDDDDYRRGRPSTHKAYGEAPALLAGDALLTYAFEIISKTSLSDSIKIKIVRELSSAAGCLGMVGGQIIDLESEDKQISLEKLFEMHDKKTGALIAAACKLGCIVGEASNEQLAAAATYGKKIGLAFQIKDDILDITSSTEELGKPVHSDDKLNKSTSVSLLGMEKATELMYNLTEEAKKSLSVFGANAEILASFADMLSKRNK